MLTTVYLDGVMGKKFGEKWELDVASPAEAIRMIDANTTGFMQWIRDKLPEIGAYRVTCTYKDGSQRDLEGSEFAMQGTPSSIRFIPLPQGSGAVGRVVLGAVMIAASFIPGLQVAAPYLMGAGLGMVAGGVIELLSPVPKTSEAERFESHYFDGPQSNTRQGNPVKLVYGTVRVGAQPVSVTMDIDQLMN